MRGRSNNQKKSHNVGKADESADRRKGTADRKRMTYEERSAQVDRQIRIIVLCGIIAVVFIAAAVAGYNLYHRQAGKNTPYDEETGTCEEGYYIGTREVEVESLYFEETAEDTLPEYSLYEETLGMDREGRFAAYNNAVKGIIYPTVVKSSDVLEGLSEEKQKEWNDAYRVIEAEESKKGEAESVADLDTLSSVEYWEIYLLCYDEYGILPQGDMAARFARNAGDALITGLMEGVGDTLLRTYLNGAFEGYATTFHYRDCEQKKADGCYWMGDSFYQYMYRYSGLTEEEKEHCALMAYFSSAYGHNVSGEEGVQHRNDLKALKEETGRILMEDFQYPESLFREN